MALVGLPYTFKFIWAPLTDHLKIPFLTSLMGRRRSWLLLSQLTLMIGIFCLGLINPAQNLKLTAFTAFIIAFASATQDIVVLAYQRERLNSTQYGAGEAASIFGYRLGLLLSGAGALYLAEHLPWDQVYTMMSTALIAGILTTFICEEPLVSIQYSSDLAQQNIDNDPTHNLLSRIRKSNFVSWFYKAILGPFKDYRRQKSWFLILLVMFFYKLGDNMIGNMQNLFYLELGFSKIDIANASKIFGMWASVLGGFIGGVLILRHGILRSLFFMAAIHGLSMLGYLVLSHFGNNLLLLYITVAIEDITGGMRVTALFAFQMSLCSPTYAATQLALFTSIVHLGRVLCSTPAGWLIEKIGWNSFLTLSVLANIPVLVLIGHLSYSLKETLFSLKRTKLLQSKLLKFLPISYPTLGKERLK